MATDANVQDCRSRLNFIGDQPSQRTQECDQRIPLFCRHIEERVPGLFRLSAVPQDCLADVARPTIMQQARMPVHNL